MSNLIDIENRDGVLVLTLNRPERKNAMSVALLDKLHQALSSGVTEDIAAVVLCGSEGCFSAGADVAELQGTIADLKVDDAIERVTTALHAAPVPVIAAIDGPCMGGAFDVAVACDMRIAASNAFFQVPATRMGLLYNPRSILRMRKLLGRDAVTNLLVLGERLDARAALECGVVARVVEGDSCFDAAFEVAIRAHGNVRGSVAATKQLLNAMDSADYDPDHWEEVRRELMSSPDRLDAIAKAKARVLK